jgi:hypothetical protein
MLYTVRNNSLGAGRETDKRAGSDRSPQSGLLSKRSYLNCRPISIDLISKLHDDKIAPKKP